MQITDEMVDRAWAEFEGRPFRTATWYEKDDIRAALSAALSGMAEPDEVRKLADNIVSSTPLSQRWKEVLANRIAATFAATPPASCLREENRWQPIDTAPRDKDILLAVVYDEDGVPWSYVTQGRWIEAEPDQIDQPGHDAGFVDCDYQCFFPGRTFGAERSRYEAKQPTHWMPLPAPPALNPEGK